MIVMAACVQQHIMRWHQCLCAIQTALNVSCTIEAQQYMGQLPKNLCWVASIEVGVVWWCRCGLALSHLEEGRRVHLQSHCRSCCHHSGASSGRPCLQVIGCQAAASHAKQGRVGRPMAPGTLSFLQPPCPATMAQERHPPFEWSLLMRAFASWKVCKAYWRPRTGAYAGHCTMQVRHTEHCLVGIPSPVTLQNFHVMIETQHGSMHAKSMT